MKADSAALMLAWGAIGLLAFAMAGLLRHLRALESAITIRRSTVGPTLGSQAPALTSLELTSPTVLLFADAECPSCTRALDELSGERTEGQPLDVAVVFRGEPNGHAGTGVRLLSHRQSSFLDFRIPMTPFAVALTKHGTIADTAAVGAAGAMKEFLDRAKQREALRA